MQVLEQAMVDVEMAEPSGERHTMPLFGARPEERSSPPDDAAESRVIPAPSMPWPSAMRA